MVEKLDKIFSPKTVAVIGASNNPGSVGYALMKNLIASGYTGIIYPVNIKQKSVLGVRCYPEVGQIPDEIDLAVIATPAATVPGLVHACGEAGVGGLLILSAGFKEVGEEGNRMAAEMLEIAQSYGMRIVGPNCLGLINPRLRLNASFANRMALPGNIAFISQSGALCTAILDWAADQNVGFSHFISIGSMIDVGFHDLIDYFGNDSRTSCILIYMESMTNARQFMSAARAFARTKPIIVLKAGRSDEGSKVAMSHTGTLAGNDASFDAAFKRAGILRVERISQMFNLAQALSMQKRPRGKRLAIVTNAGGPGVLATDYLMAHGGELAQFTSTTFGRLNEILPPTWSHRDPVDVLGDASPERYREAIKACLADPNVDGLLTIFTPQAITRPEAVAEELLALAKKTNKTMLAAWLGEQDVEEARDILEAGGIPNYRYPESAVDSFLKMYQYAENIKLLTETPATIPHQFTPDTDAARAMLDDIIDEGRYALTENEAKALMRSYQIPVLDTRLVHSPEEAGKVAAELGFPVVMKIVSPDIQHKTDVGGVQLNITSASLAERTFNHIMDSARAAKPEADLVGVLIEPMVGRRYELLIGSKKDPIFGPVIVFGMGGVAVEVFKDLHMGLPPLNMNLAQRIIEETKIYKLLQGYRGMPGVDIPSIQFLLYKFAYLVMDFPEIAEIDINPFVVDENGGVVLDAKVILDKETAGKDVAPYSHLIIRPYPKEYITSYTLQDGREAVLRPIRPEDEPMEEEMFTKFSEQTQYFRFFEFIPQVTHSMLIRFTQIDYDREMAIIAELEEDGRKVMAGVARIVADITRNSAEFAIVIADPWQGQGLGNRMTDYILEIAAKMQIKTVYANILKQNVKMVHILKKRGFRITSKDFETCYAEAEVASEMVLSPQ
ncbi:MAG: bifunctional acyl-CoA synthetase/GNAT family N-acetyltransferase [Bacteroidetes bacterium]|nr:MAG: bifunctional acyl-CoA synthetase/GNAT family N-acetyltransferase [Bacteroidota bacterium]